MRFKAFWLSLSAAVVAIAPSPALSQRSPQHVVDAMAAGLQVRYQIVANRGDGGCEVGGVASEPPQDACFEIALSITSPDAIAANTLDKNWAIYFSQVDPLLVQAPGEFLIEHINGDLHRITPSATFTGFQAGETKTLQFIGRWVTITESKMMPNYYVVADGEGITTQARIIDSTRLAIDPETGLEIRPYAMDLPADQAKLSGSDQTPIADSTFLYGQNQEVMAAPVDDPHLAARTLLPTPKHQIDHGGELDLASGLNLSIRGVDPAALEAALTRLEQLGIEQSPQGVTVTIDVTPNALSENAPLGSYQLFMGTSNTRNPNNTSNTSNITIQATDASGAFYGLQSLASLVTLGKTSVPLVTVTDEPRYAYRGLHVDVARNFHSKQLILDLLDQMAAYKLNTLHFDLGNDEGWRLEIPGLPELTDMGAKRCHDLQENSCLLVQLGSGPTGTSQLDGYYSREDYIDLVKAAEARHIQVIPALDMPGHARAAVKAMEARYRHFMAQGNPAAAEQYLLSDLDDRTEYRSTQHYFDNTINVCMESSYRFVQKVVDEVQLMHAEAGQPLTTYHISADEIADAWKDSPMCQMFLTDNTDGVTEVSQLGPYFIQRVAALLHGEGITTAAWSDGLSTVDPDHMPPNVLSYMWNVLPWGGVAEANKQANQGWQAVLSTADALYFDFPYEADPKEGGYYWASRRVNTRKVFNFMPGNLPALAEVYVDPQGHSFEITDQTPLRREVAWLGVQGQLWSETIRSDEATEYMLFPRLLALAERAWHQPDWELPYDYDGQTYNASSGYFTADLQQQRDADWRRFANVLGHKELAKLDAANIQYRVPTVGAVIDRGVLKANLAFPGLGIEYRVDGGRWRPYGGPVAVSGLVDVRGIAADGIRKGRSLRVQ